MYQKKITFVLKWILLHTFPNADHIFFYHTGFDFNFLLLLLQTYIIFIKKFTQKQFNLITTKNKKPM